MTGGYNYAANSSSSMSSVSEYFGGRSWPSAARASMHNHIHGVHMVLLKILIRSHGCKGMSSMKQPLLIRTFVIAVVVVVVIIVTVVIVVGVHCCVVFNPIGH